MKSLAPPKETDQVPYIAFMAHVRRLFTRPGPHPGLIANVFAKGTLRQPAQPMSDHELAHAIREFQNMPLSDAALRKPGARLVNPKPER